jgi:hypothetical protein
MNFVKRDIPKISFGLFLMVFLIGIPMSMWNIQYVNVKAQDIIDASTVALWHLDEVDPQNITPDATGINNGTLAGSPPPTLVEGKFGQALSFNGADFLFVTISPSLDFQSEFTIEAWINVKAFRNNTHNNILVKSTRDGPDWIHASRIVGLAVKAGLEQDGVEVPQGGLGAFVFTDESGFSEVVTKGPVILLNQWHKIAFTRSFATGLHIYVDEVEKETMLVHGIQNPVGSVLNGTELYIGHDAEVIIDEPRISNIAREFSESTWLEPDWFLIVLIVIVFILASTGLLFYFKKRMIIKSQGS